MSAADVVLFSLSFLACALLAAWIRSVARERDRFPRHVPARVRDPEVGRLSGSLESALTRIEALESRNEDLERRNEALTRLVHSRVAVEPTVPGAAVPGGSGPEGAASAEPAARGSVAGTSVEGSGRRVAAVPVPDEDLGSAEEQEEVSPSQWRSAMDRLGPVWPSGGRSADAVPRSTSPGAPVEPGTSSGSTPSGSASSGSVPWGSQPWSSGASGSASSGSAPSGSGTAGVEESAPQALGEQGAPTSPWSRLSAAALAASTGRVAPLDDLFPPPGAVGVPAPAAEATRNGTAREQGGPLPS